MSYTATWCYSLVPSSEPILYKGQKDNVNHKAKDDSRKRNKVFFLLFVQMHEIDKSILDRGTGIKMEQWKKCFSLFIFPWGCCVSVLLQLNLSYEV